MKKLLAIVMIAGSLITSVFAQENGKEKLSTFINLNHLIY